MVAGEPVALLVIDTLPVSLPAAEGLNCTPKEKCIPGATATGVPAPESAKPVPLTPICEIVTWALPVLLSVTVCDAELPAVTLPKLRLLALAESVYVGAGLLPLSVTLAGEFVALLTIETLPLSVPAADGLNCTLNDTLCPTASVTGTVAPVTAKPVPLAAICETATEELPELVSVTSCVEVLPALTLPKLRLLGLTVSVCVEARLLPLRAMVAGEFAAVLTSDRLPVTVPADCGTNSTLNEVVWPAATVIGNESPLVLNPLPVTFACVIVRLAVPVLLTCTACELVLPSRHC